MSGFGEALMSSFNATYGMVSRAQTQSAMTRLYNARASAEEDELERDRDYFGGIKNLQAQHQAALTGAAPQAPQVAAPQAPQAPALPAPTQAPALPAPTQAPVQAAAPTPAPAPTQAPQQSPAPQPGAPTGAQGVLAGAVPTEAAPPQPPIAREVVQQAVTALDKSTAPAIDAVVIAGAMQPTTQRAPGQFQDDLNKVPRMVQEITRARGDETGPITRANWNTYAEQVFLLAQRTRKPAEVIQVMTAMDNVRTAGLQNRLAMASAAALAGDVQGAVNSLNSAGNFLPDGQNYQARAVNGGIVIGHGPEKGEKGPTGTSPVIPLSAIPQYATMMIDPKWTLGHMLNREKHAEDVRSHKANEGIAGANLKLRAGELAFNQKLRLDALNDKQEIEKRGAHAVRTSMALRRAETELDAATKGGDPTAIAAARSKMETAAGDFVEAMAVAPSAAATAIARIDATYAGIDARKEIASDRASGRRPLDADDRKAWRESIAELTAATTPKDAKAPNDPSDRWALSNMMNAAVYNPNTLDPSVAFPALRENHQFMRSAAMDGIISPAEYQKYVQNPYTFASKEGLRMNMPGGAMPNGLQTRLNDYIQNGMKPPTRGAGGESDGSAGGTSLSGARPTPTLTYQHQRQPPVSSLEAVTGSAALRDRANAPPDVSPAPSRGPTPRSYREMPAAVAAAKRLGVDASAVQLGEIARQYGIPPAELRAALAREK